MSLIEIILIAISLSADACAVATCKGIYSSNHKIKDALKIGFLFGTFQMLMPILGYFLAQGILVKIINYSNIFTSIILLIIALRMISDAKSNLNINNNLDIKELLVLSIATSLDAFAIGLTFSISKIKILYPVIIIGIITFFLSFLCFCIGNNIGLKWKSKALISGAIILIIIALKTLFDI